MYAVIFRAKIAELDDEYHRVTEQMRQLAVEKFGCTGFISMTEGNEEVAISYWETEEHIKRWKSDPAHLWAQQKGRSKWYQTYHVQVVKVIRAYGKER